MILGNMSFVLLVFNIQSNTNIGQLIRTANAFGAKEICVVGRKKYSTYGNKRTAATTSIRHFFSVGDALSFYKAQNYDIAGIEIGQHSKSINEIEFSRDTVFILGNEGTGIQNDILIRCDYCVFIPQFGSGASINVNTACGIVFNVFTKHRTDFNTIIDCKFTPKQSLDNQK